jgi:hypothetical protein
MSAVQASIMMLVYENDKLKFDDIRTAFAVPDAEKAILKFTIGPLLVGRAKIPLLDLVPSGKKRN